jgi:hypothetical protein
MPRPTFQQLLQDPKASDPARVAEAKRGLSPDEALARLRANGFYDDPTPSEKE